MPVFEGPGAPFQPGEYRVCAAGAPWQVAALHALRREVFCAEQRIFPSDDRDAIDAVAIHLVALTCLLGAPDQVVGTVRIHQPEPGVWWGSRLAVHRDHRRVGGLGAALIRLAVCTATARGARSFLAHVQAQNVEMFRRLHWETLDEVALHGHPHHLMRADLAAYPPQGAAPARLLRPLRAA
jgi:putative N-acetyltransferase (TIGR04045 family)